MSVNPGNKNIVQICASAKKYQTSQIQLACNCYMRVLLLLTDKNPRGNYAENYFDLEYIELGKFLLPGLLLRRTHLLPSHSSTIGKLFYQTGTFERILDIFLIALQASIFLNQARHRFRLRNLELFLM